MKPESAGSTNQTLFPRQNLLGNGLNGPSLPLDVGQP
jgi:hypothetical protein